MRILQLITRRQLRGAEVFASQLADSLVTRGHLVGLAALYGPPGEPPLVAGRAEHLQLEHPLGSRLSPRLIRALAAHLRSWEPDVVQANGSDTLKYSILARRLSGRAVPIVYRNISMAGAWLRGPLHRAWNRWLAHQADRVAAVSPAAAEDYAAAHGLPQDRVTTIPIGTPVPESASRHAGRARLGALLGENLPELVLFNAASFTPEKDHQTLIDAFARVAQVHQDAILVLAGDGPLRPAITRRVARLGLNARVIFLGARRDLPELLREADLFVLSSRIEGLPGVLLEAAASGLPIVATDVGSVSDIVIEGRSGLMVSAGDPEALAEALLALLNDPTTRRAFGAAGRELVVSSYEMETIVDRFEALYYELIERKRADDRKDRS